MRFHGNVAVELATSIVVAELWQVPDLSLLDLEQTGKVSLKNVINYYQIVDGIEIAASESSHFDRHRPEWS